MHKPSRDLHKQHKKYLLAMIVPLLMTQMSTAYAQEQAEGAVELDSQKVIIKRVGRQEVGKSVITAEQISRNMVSDSRDLVRHETGVTVVEAGRFGSSGYSIRGVDENRVAITVDGLQQSETLSSEGFKELFAGYGNFNNTRNTVEFETLKSAHISRGADSVSMGSGALGGAVSFKTKDARDFLTDKDHYLGYKVGYSSVDNQIMNSLTAAARHKWLDALVVATHRGGHETENYGYHGYDDNAQGLKRKKADPYEITKKSALVKLAVSPNDNHRFTVTSDIYEHRAIGEDLSYSLNALKTNFNEKVAEKASRHTDDSSKRKYFAISYENSKPNFLWDELNVSLSNQKISNRAKTDDYCDHQDASRCETIYNAAGLKLDGNKTVDAQGRDLVFKDQSSSTIVVDGQQIYVKNDRIDQEWFDCSIYDCTKPIEGYETVNGEIRPRSYALDLSKKVEFQGRTFVPVDGTGLTYRNVFIRPNSPGFLDRAYKDRELNTHTKQFNLDASKRVDLPGFGNKISYGASYSITDKEMVNKEGFYAYNTQWWANRFIGYKDINKTTLHTCQTAFTRTKTSVICPTFGEPTSFLVPVRSKTGAIYLSNKMRLGERVALNLGYRYDNISYQPRYEHGVSPRIPESMIDELFVPYVPPEGAPGPRPSSLSEFNYDFAAYNKALAEWNKKNEEFGLIVEKAKADNVKANFDYFTQPKKYSAHSYLAELAIDPTPFLRLQYKYASGFRAPTTDEMYFTFKHPDFTIFPNVNLKAEVAKTQEVATTLHNELGQVTLSAFKTNYDNFIDLKYLGVVEYKNASGVEAQAQPHQTYQNVNRNDAKVIGYEINSQLNAGALHQKLDGINLSYKATYQKGRYEGNVPLNAIQPLTHVAGIAYDDPNGRYGINVHYTHARSKKAADTYDMYATTNAISPIKWRSNNYSVWDLTAYVQPSKNVRLRAGVYNLLNEKYTTWESARSIRPFGTSNRVSQTGEGTERFLSPGRNVKIGAEFTF